MNLNTKHHGIIDYEEKEIINFKKGLPGFEHLKKFIVYSIEENNIFSVLQSLEEKEIGIPVLSPFIVCSDYEVKLTEEQIKNLKIKSEEEVWVLNTVTINSDYKEITTNLRAPIIINIKERIGEQIILKNEEYKIKYPIFQEENKC
ncbi:flagellar assembly protein FliW [Clostridium tetani]|uniref:flagellar assembly protein FliW n=1 Tax=Clostridium tetani TaxID=1513 RepID=UPI002955AF55|nr:flagellar assembly protein FliW [Clostridium tetani]BDR75932.1 flagellar assembly factor FliW [Clostridium tetani]